MPSKNVVKEFAPEQYYHVYNRGVEKRVIFLDDEDYRVFLGIMKRFITGEKVGQKHRHKINVMNSQIKLLAYCLMPNHFHLLLYQESEDGITKFMRKVATSYSMYFNNKYQRVGGLFQGRYRAAHVNADSYLHHISRYIHMNSDDYLEYPYSSLKYYMRPSSSPKWLDVSPVLGLFSDNPQEYTDFLEDYELTKKERGEIKRQLAD